MPVPKHLQDGGPRGAQIGRGAGYTYPHDHPGGYIPQDYGIPRGTYYKPTDRGKEAEFKKRLDSHEEDEETSKTESFR